MTITAKKSRIGLFLAAMFLLLAFSGLALAEGWDDLKDLQDVEVVKNPSQPLGAVEHWYLEQEWLVGGDESELLIGLPTRVTTDAQGRIYVLDAHLNQVHVFSQVGEHLGTHFREGEGPGEIQNPSDLIVWPDGAMGVVQEFPGQIICLNSQGDPAPTLHPGGDPETGGWSVLMSGRARGGNLVICGAMTRQNEGGKSQQKAYLTLFDPAGQERKCLMEEVVEGPSGPTGEKDLLKPYMLAWDVGPDGRAYVTMTWEEYMILVFNPEGRLERIIERDFEPWRRTKAEKNKINAFFGASGGDPSFTLKLADYAPCISIYQRGVQVTDDGQLWVLSSRGNRQLPEGVLARFDVFDEKGKFQKQVEMHCPGDPWNDQLLVLSPDQVIRTRRFVDALITSLGPGALPDDQRSGEDMTPAVISYRVKRKSK